MRHPPRTVARDVCAALAALVVYLACAPGGLFFYATLPQVALMVGCMTGLIATSRVRSGALAALALVVGWQIMPPGGGTYYWYRDSFTKMLACTAGAVAVAVVMHWLALARGGVVVRATVTCLIALLIVNLWITSYALQPVLADRSALSMLNSKPTGTIWQDFHGYLLMYLRQKQGYGYYQAVRVVYPQWLGAPHSLFDVRPPTVLASLSAVTARPTDILPLFLTFASVAVVGASILGGSLVRWQFAVTGAAALTSMCLFFVYSYEMLLFTDSWAVLLAIISLAALVYSATHSKWHAPFALGVVVAVLAAISREFLLVVPFAGLVAVTASPEERRKRQVIGWTVGWALVVAFYAAHWTATASVIAHWPGGDGSGGGTWQLGPSLDNLVRAIEYFTGTYGDMLVDFARATVTVFAATGLLGIFLTKPAGPRRLLLATAIPLFVFLVSARNSSITETGLVNSYWGIPLFTLLTACIPLAFALFPGMAWSRSPTK